jgi:hypothetical protein
LLLEKLAEENQFRENKKNQEASAQEHSIKEIN